MASKRHYLRLNKVEQHILSRYRWLLQEVKLERLTKSLY
jgi:hypothetical protein